MFVYTLWCLAFSYNIVNVKLVYLTIPAGSNQSYHSENVYSNTNHTASKVYY